MARLAYLPTPGIASINYLRRRRLVARTPRLADKSVLHESKMSIQPAYGMRDVLAKGNYRGAILDQFGVLHDGQTPYPNAIDTLTAMRNAGIHIVVLSNSSRRADHAVTKLRDMGCGDLDVITSGELAHHMLLSEDSPLRGCSTTVHTNWVGRGDVRPLENGIRTPWNCMVPQGQESAVDSVVMHGAEGITLASGRVQAVSWEDLKSFCYNVGKARPQIPVVCVNPDIVTVDAGTLRNMPGALAAEFERGGGTSVLRIGKPGSTAYNAALSCLANNGVTPDQVICVGDSVAHDIVGAQSTQPSLDNVYIAGGINAHTFGLDPAGVLGADEPWQLSWELWTRIVEQDAPGCKAPTFALPYFRW